MEMEYFVPPAEAAEWFSYWVEQRVAWHRRCSLRESHLRVRPHDAESISHYSSATSDIEYLFPIGWSELEGIAHRGDFDLTAHTEASGTKLEWVDGQERYTPHVVEPALGVNRSMLAFMVDAYDEEVVAERERTVLGSTRSRPGEGCGAPADRKERRHGGEGAHALRGSSAAPSSPNTTTRARSAAAIGARTRSELRTRSRSTTRPSRTTRSRSATATRSRRRESRSPEHGRSCSTGSPRTGRHRSRTRRRVASSTRSLGSVNPNLRYRSWASAVCGYHLVAASGPSSTEKRTSSTPRPRPRCPSRT